MKKKLFEDQPATKRSQYLLDNCEKAEELGYMKKFTTEDIRDMKDRLSEVSIDINEIEDEKKKAAAVFKQRLTPLSDEKGQLLKNIKTKAIHVKETCYKFVDEQDRTVGYYNALGDLVDERPMNPTEYQRTIFPTLRPTGTSDKE